MPTQFIEPDFGSLEHAHRFGWLLVAGPVAMNVGVTVLTLIGLA